MVNPRVLVVDDYPGARYRRMRILQDDGGFDVAEAAMGREALHRAAAERFDLVVLDVHLPDISGLEVCRALRAEPRLAGVPILMVSAVADKDEAERLALEAGATAFIPDHADAAAFLSAARDVLARRVV